MMMVLEAEIRLSLAYRCPRRRCLWYATRQPLLLEAERSRVRGFQFLQSWNLCLEAHNRLRRVSCLGLLDDAFHAAENMRVMSCLLLLPLLMLLHRDQCEHLSFGRGVQCLVCSSSTAFGWPSQHAASPERALRFASLRDEDVPSLPSTSDHDDVVLPELSQRCLYCVRQGVSRAQRRIETGLEPSESVCHDQVDSDASAQASWA